MRPNEMKTKTIFWCGRGDSNPHALRRHPLKMVRLPVPPLPHGVKKNGIARYDVRLWRRRPYFDGGGAAGAGATGAEAGALGAAGAVLDVFENCCSTEEPVEAAVEFWCMVSAMDVSMNMMAHHVVALDKNVAAPRGPKAVWLPAPPKAPAKSAASPLCSMITMIKSPQMITCNVTSIKYNFHPSARSANPTAIEIAHFTSFGIAFP